MFENHKFLIFQEKTFDFVIKISFILLLVTLFGFSQNAPEYLSTLDYYLKIYICLFLIWRFNPLRSKFQFTNLDAKISFNAGLFILASTALNEYVKFIEVDIVSKIKEVFFNTFYYFRFVLFFLIVFLRVLFFDELLKNSCKCVIICFPKTLSISYSFKFLSKHS